LIKQLEAVMKFTDTINIWELSQKQIAKLKPGQWVSAGQLDANNKGIFCGVKKSGSVVVAWEYNARATGNFRQYVDTLMNYAKSC
jgi:hypothetical protein